MALSRLCCVRLHTERDTSVRPLLFQRTTQHVGTARVLQRERSSSGKHCKGYQDQRRQEGLAGQNEVVSSARKTHVLSLKEEAHSVLEKGLALKSEDRVGRPSVWP